MKKRVLIIEDDKEITELIEIHLNDLHIDVIKAHNGRDGLAIAFKQKLDLIILDLTIPLIDGIEVCKKIRSKLNVPIIIVSGRNEEIDKVLGLEIGADDYITKPFSIRELISRVKALFRRTQMNNEVRESVLQFNGMSINLNQRKVIVNNSKVELSPKEFELLKLMASNPGKNYNRQNLLQLIWGYDFAGYEHTVNSHINRLRTKIEFNTSNPKYIITRWGIGYKFNEEV